MAGEATRFKAGQSGNPGGRPKGIGAKAREHADKALDVLVDAMGDADARVRIAAAKELLDRGWGKPVAMTAELSKGAAADMSDEELDAAIEALVAKMRGDGSKGSLQ